MLDGPVVAGIVLAGGAVVVGGYLYIDHLRHARGGERTPRTTHRLPLFGVDVLGPSEDGESRRPTTPIARPTFSPRQPAAAPPPVVEPAAPAPALVQQHAAFAAPRSNGATRHTPAYPNPRFADGATLRFALPDAGTLQFLPGRLEVIAGPESGREIRFVRSPDGGDTDVTFGRSEGPPHRHIQLLVPTVSRRHAVMSLLDEHWSLQNLSATNPVTHNGRRLAPDEVVPLLVDGDRIEMGEVVFVFHGR